MKEKKYGIWGWWQGNNLGDNWIKKTLSYYFPTADFIETSIQSFEEYDFVICGGGGLFVYDVISPWNNLTNKILKKTSFGMLGLGAEFPHDSNTALNVYNKAKFFYVRDQYSLDCMHLSHIERSYDITFSKPLNRVEESEINTEKLFFVWRDGHELLQNDKFNKYIQNGSSKEEWDEHLRGKFADIVEDDFQTNGDNIEERIEGCGFVVSGRYHGVVAAIQKGLPFIAIDICPKIRALLEECGLVKYCVKISEIEKVDALINDALTNIDAIRKKELAYTTKANSVLQKQLKYAKLEVMKVIHPLKVIHYGSYWMKKNDVVNTMADDLGKVCKTKKIDLKVYSTKPSRRIKQNEQTPNGKLCMLDHSKIVRDVKWRKADAVILNSGGLYLEDKTYDYLKNEGIVTVGISLSDPDVFPYNGKVYADKFELFYTNSKYSYLNEYNHDKVNIGIMPFAASVDHHYYMENVSKDYDVVVVAHAREDRKLVVENLSQICKVGTYGAGWEHSLGVVNGKEHVRAINSGKMYLSFARTVAGFDNVKVGLFEAMACNQVVITSYMEELQDYFDIGTEILCYKDEKELYELVKYYIKHDEEREQIRKRGYQRFLKYHTYEKRWNDVLMSIYKTKGLL